MVIEGSSVRRNPNVVSHRKLAAAVVQQAGVDWRKGPRDSVRDKKRYNGAVLFLSGNLYPWADMLDMDPAVIRSHIGFSEEVL